jgi:DNA-binding transcriptional regulator YhcF (GntR family)
MLDIAIQKGVSISLHDQLVTQVAMQVASGMLPAGTRLPSVRKLSAQLGIHYNTCLAAYRDLETLGFITIRQGSGVTVADLKPEEMPALQENWELAQLARYFVKQVTRKGYRWEEVLCALDSARANLERNADATTLVFVDHHADIMPLFQAELGHFLGLPVKASLVSDVDPKTAAPGTLYLTSRYHVRGLEKALGKGNHENIFVMDVGGGQQEKALVRQVPDGELVAIVSHSATILQQAEAVISALRGDELLVRTVLWDEGEAEIRQALRYAHVILGDFLAAPGIGVWTRKPVGVIRVVPDEEIRRIREHLQGLPG